MRNTSRRDQRATLRGWWKWLPFLVVPFSLVMFEARLHARILANQYEANALRTKLGEIEGKIDVLQDDQHGLTRLDHIASQAPELELVEPRPGHVVVVKPKQPAPLFDIIAPEADPDDEIVPAAQPPAQRETTVERLAALVDAVRMDKR